MSYLQSLEDPISIRKGAINGVAAGAGFNLALSCDIVLCCKSARFVQSFAKVGLIPDCGGFYLLPKIVGIYKAKELMFTADILGADAALRVGIINTIYEDDRLSENVYALAKRLAEGAPIALGMIKTMVNRSNHLIWKGHWNLKRISKLFV